MKGFKYPGTSPLRQDQHDWTGTTQGENPGGTPNIEEKSKIKQFMEKHGVNLTKIAAQLLANRVVAKKEPEKDPADNFARLQLGIKASPMTKKTPLKAFGHIKAIFGADKLPEQL